MRSGHTVPQFRIKLENMSVTFDYISNVYMLRAFQNGVGPNPTFIGSRDMAIPYLYIRVLLYNQPLQTQCC